ncbi:MAG TPA: AbrB/MazE/SpoVT family DNA-binding domain-containing protein [Candidatus Nanoarchaeia archaeon]|nr:AbrB/MazE/SpoVT family DNA-binding domain-containing protein [Candidatus Nanoarchaeia archaeon]
MGIAKITRNYQITIPKDIREIKDLKEGDSVVFTIDGNKVQLVKMNKDSIRLAAGLWSKTKESGVEYERRVRAGWKKRLKRERNDPY